MLFVDCVGLYLRLSRNLNDYFVVVVDCEDDDDGDVENVHCCLDCRLLHLFVVFSPR